MFAEPANEDLAQPRLVLASASPRRALLLREHGYQFEVIPPNLEEPKDVAAKASPAQCAEALSYYKARSVAERVQGGVILGADTIAALGTTIFGKPVDREDARRILTQLFGTTHEVITGITLIDGSNGNRVVAHERTAITMVPIAPRQLEDYLDSGAWRGKAGAYGIQDHGDAFIRCVQGSFSNVVGLPIELVSRLLEERGIRPEQAPGAS